MTTATRAALDAAIDEYGSAAYDLGYVLHDPHEDARRRPRRDAARTALDRAIAAHVEAEVARRLEAAAGVEEAIDHLRRVDRQSYASGGVESVWPARKALLVAIAADRARAVAEAVEAAEDAAFIRGRDAVRKYPGGWGLIACPTPDEARSIGRVAEHLRGLAAEVEPSRMADGFEADRMRTLAHRLRMAASLMPTADEARRLVEEFEGLAQWQSPGYDAARTALLRALGVEA